MLINFPCLLNNFLFVYLICRSNEVEVYSGRFGRGAVEELEHML